jgi:hypothetical protein
MYTLHLRGKYALGGLDLNTWVCLIPKETSFIDPIVKQTILTLKLSIISSKAKITQQNNNKIKKTNINGKIQQENSRRKLSCEAHTQSV